MRVHPKVFERFYELLCDNFVKRELANKYPTGSKTKYNRKIWRQRRDLKNMFAGFATSNPEYFFRMNSKLKTDPNTEIDALSLYKGLLYLNSQEFQDTYSASFYEENARKLFLKFTIEHSSIHELECRKLNEIPSKSRNSINHKTVQFVKESETEESLLGTAFDLEQNLNALKKYYGYGEYYNLIPEAESLLYKKWQSLVVNRIHREKNELNFNKVLLSEIFLNNFLKSDWVLFEKLDNKIVKRSIFFEIKEDLQTHINKSVGKRVVRMPIRFGIDWSETYPAIFQYDLLDGILSVQSQEFVFTFSANIETLRSKHFLGHTMKCLRNSRTISFNPAALSKHTGGATHRIGYEEYDISSAYIPKEVISFLKSEDKLYYSKTYKNLFSTLHPVIKTINQRTELEDSTLDRQNEIEDAKYKLRQKRI